MQNALIKTNTLPLPLPLQSYFSYINCNRKSNVTKNNSAEFELVNVKLEETEEMFSGFLTKETNSLVPAYKLHKTDLPLTSDFGKINSPYELVYARLEGLQFTNRI